MTRNSMIPVCTLALCLLPANLRADIRWRKSFDAAQSEAAKAKAPLLLEFYADWCGPCKKMAAETFTDANVQKLMSRTVPVRIDIDRQPKLAEKYGVTSIPRMVVIGTNGKPIMDALGFRPAEILAEELTSALGGKPVIDQSAGVPAANVEPPDVLAVRAQSANPASYPAWRLKNLPKVQSACGWLVAQLGDFDKAKRDGAAKTLSGLGDDAVEALITGLAHQHLAVRVAAHDALARMLEAQYRLDLTRAPRMDAWEPRTARATQASAVREWWRRSKPATRSAA